MSDDLVEQLRAKRVYSDEGNCWADPGCSEAADRIEHLEDRCANLLVENGILNNRIEKLDAALREIIDRAEYRMGHHVTDAVCAIAREALEGKDD